MGHMCCGREEDGWVRIWAEHSKQNTKGKFCESGTWKTSSSAQQGKNLIKGSIEKIVENYI